MPRKPRKRPPGQGTVFERGGNWWIKWRDGGRRRSAKFPTEDIARRVLAVKVAETAARRAGLDVGDGSLVEKRRADVGFAEVAEEWLRLHSATKPRSHDLNAANYRVHVAPFLGDAPLSAVSGKRVLELRAHLMAKARTRRERDDAGEVREIEYKLSAATVNNVMALMRSILLYAVATGHLTASPTKTLGRGLLMLKVEKPQLAAPIDRPEDVGRLLEAIRELRPDRHAMFAAFVYLGARKGEVCGLRWADVDLEARMISIRRSYSSGWTKSGKHRKVPIPPPLVAILRRHRLEEPHQGELVFPNDRGGTYTKNGKLEDVLRAALRRVGLPQIRIHDLRHVHAAHFLMAGGSIFDLQKNLGHHAVSFTAEVYGHLSADHRVKESDRLNGLFDAPAPGKVIPFEKPSGHRDEGEGAGPAVVPRAVS